MQQISEDDRLSALRSYGVLDSPREEDFDKLTAMVARLYNTAISSVTLVAKDRFFFKSMFGADVRNMDRCPGFCDTAIQSEGVHCIEDATTDPVVRDHPMVRGEPYIRSYAGAPLVTSDGFAIGTLCIMDSEVRDFTRSERRLLQELAEFVMFHLDRRRLLAESQKHEEKRRDIQELESLGMLSGEIAHDYKNYLAGILGNASLAARQIDKDSPAQESVAGIIQAVSQASELTGQLLAYAGQQPTRPMPTKLPALISDMSPLLRRSIGRNTRFDTEYAADLSAAIVDPAQLHQIVLNLVTNASDAHQGGAGLVHLAVDQVEFGPDDVKEDGLDYLDPGAYLRVEISDNGCGMDADTRDSAFKPFFTTKLDGCGLGLPIAQRIVLDHGGHIQVESEPEEGSTVFFLLPADTTSEVSASDNGAATQSTIAACESVLVVDDEENVIRMTSSVLKRFGCRVHSAMNGKEAVEHAKGDGEFDVLILDATMPGMNGAETLDAINEHRPNLSTIITTGHHIDEVAGQFAKFSNLTFLQKPWTLEQLSAALQAAVSKQGEPTVPATDGAAA